VLDYALKNRLPTIADFAQPSDNRDARPLLVYAPAWSEIFPQAATYISRILKGAKPGDLPIQQPARFELEVNLKASSAIGLKLPQSLLLRADRVIE
jgi:putative ABC transport system substrate-binding protein